MLRNLLQKKNTSTNVAFRLKIRQFDLIAGERGIFTSPAINFVGVNNKYRCSEKPFASLRIDPLVQIIRFAITFKHSNTVYKF
ncbi:hypothetical protein L596_024449 [Steinernema carpocapsae]|uniref:Uncharacterized protein n=1 Tax=Steinernema carpocapsae TaxID=34508 RepID=A0A4U5MGT1_STECR|nr:hypothetical protein L596_024449 [Steinernema carpocapsae]